MAMFTKGKDGAKNYADSTMHSGQDHRKREIKHSSKRAIKKPWHCCMSRLDGVPCPGTAFTTDEMWRHLETK